jgi:proteasome lid subunit RPN8/RPN11
VPIFNVLLYVYVAASLTVEYDHRTWNATRNHLVRVCVGCAQRVSCSAESVADGAACDWCALWFCAQCIDSCIWPADALRALATDHPDASVRSTLARHAQRTAASLASTDYDVCRVCIHTDAAPTPAAINWHDDAVFGSSAFEYVAIYQCDGVGRAPYTLPSTPRTRVVLSAEAAILMFAWSHGHRDEQGGMLYGTTSRVGDIDVVRVERFVALDNTIDVAATRHSSIEFDDATVFAANEAQLPLNNVGWFHSHPEPHALLPSVRDMALQASSGIGIVLHCAASSSKPIATDAQELLAYLCDRMLVFMW